MQILIGAHVLVSLIQTISFQVLNDAFLAYPDPLLLALLDPDSFLRALNAEDVFIFAGIVQIGVFIACGICFLCWLHRSYANLARLTAPSSEVVGWLIPIYNLVHGYRSTRRLYLENQRPVVPPRGYVLPPRAAIVGWWWSFCLLTLAIANASVVLRLKGGGQLWAFTASDLVAAVLCMTVVQRIDRRQREQLPVPSGSSP